MKLIRAVLKLSELLGAITLLYFFVSFLDSGIAFTTPPQNHPSQRTQFPKDNVRVNSLHAFQVVAITPTAKTTIVEYQDRFMSKNGFMSNRMKTVAADDRYLSLDGATGTWTPDILASNLINDILIDVDPVCFATDALRM